MTSLPRYFWPRLLILISAGVAVSLQIGKVPAALPFIQADLSLSLVQTGWVVSIFGLVAALFAAFLGALADRIGQMRAALIGMTLTATAAFLGSLTTDGAVLLALRVVEGFGYLLTATSVPPLILRFAPEHMRQRSMALWALFVPIGSFLMMVISGPVLEAWDWRVLWVLTGAMILSASIPVWLVARTIPKIGQASAPTPRQTINAAFRPPPMLGMATFLFYAGNYFVITGFLPLTLIEDGVSPVLGASLGAIVIGFNAFGILCGGWLMGRGAKPSQLIMIGGGVMFVLGWLIFITALPVPVRVSAAIIAIFAGAFVPCALFAAIPRLAGDASAISTMSGLLAQGSGIGTGAKITATLLLTAAV